VLRAFVLIRRTTAWDGSQSEARVAEGIEFSDGHVALRWQDDGVASGSTFDSISDVDAALSIDDRTFARFTAIAFGEQDITHVDVTFKEV
jgi:hypothetical protein